MAKIVTLGEIMLRLSPQGNDPRGLLRVKASKA